MVEKIFGLLFIIGSVFFAWKFNAISTQGESNKKKISITSAIKQNSTSQTEIKESSDFSSPIVADIRNLMDQQVEFVGLSDNIQRISFKTHLESKSLNNEISKSLQKVAVLSATSPYLLEAEVFDMSGPPSLLRKQDKIKKLKNTKSVNNSEEFLPDKIVFQFSIYDVRSLNKLSEFGATYDLELINPKFTANTTLDKKKPDETSASSGSK